MRSDNKAGTGCQVHGMDGRRGASRDDLIIDARREASRADEATANDLRDEPGKRAAAGEQAPVSASGRSFSRFCVREYRLSAVFNIYC